MKETFLSAIECKLCQDVKQTEILTTELLLDESSAFEVERAIKKLRKHNSPVTDRIPAEFVKAEIRTSQSEIHKLMNSV
jgi:TPP-dependent 2-oxoacid decarboxylase